MTPIRFYGSTYPAYAADRKRSASRSRPLALRTARLYPIHRNRGRCPGARLIAGAGVCCCLYSIPAGVRERGLRRRTAAGDVLANLRCRASPNGRSDRFIRPLDVPHLISPGAFDTEGIAGASGLRRRRNEPGISHFFACLSGGWSPP